MDHKSFEENINEYIGKFVSAVVLELIRKSEGLPQKKNLVMEEIVRPGFRQPYEFQLREFLTKMLEEIDQRFLLTASGVGIENNDTQRIIAGLKT